MSKPPPKSRPPFKTGGRPDERFAGKPRGRDSHPSPREAGRPGGGIPAPSVGRALMLYGVHPVSAAWLNPDRPCRHLYGTQPALAALAPVIAQASALGLKRPSPIVVDRDAIEKMLPLSAVHQGLALDAEPLPEINLDDVLIAAGNGPTALVLLDQVTDPHNVGAILRSAAALGAKGVIVQTRHAPEITGVLAKSASGA
jgi:23S rRNA (guanosine2251-2'-O)-methyltransferase